MTSEELLELMQKNKEYMKERQELARNINFRKEVREYFNRNGFRTD